MRGFWDGTDKASTDKLGDIPGHTGPPVPSLEERESKLAAWVSRARGSMKGAQKGGSQEGGDIGFPSGPPGGAGSLRVLPGPTGWGSRGRLVEELVLEWRALQEREYRRGSPPWYSCLPVNRWRKLKLNKKVTLIGPGGGLAFWCSWDTLGSFDP